MSELIAVGRVGRAVGIHGEFKVVPLTDVAGRFKSLKQIQLGRDNLQTVARTVERVRSTSDAIVVKLEGLDTPEEVVKVSEQYLFVTPEDSAPPRKGTYRIHEIIGSRVWTEEGVEIGILVDVFSRAPNDLWSVKMKDKEVLVPAVKEFIRSVDAEKKEIVIHVIEGLLD